MKQEISLKIGGAAGQGVKTAGFIITKALKDLGAWTFSYSEYPSLIRGGHSTFQINISKEKIYSATKKVDFLIALNAETVEKHFSDVNKNGLILCDNDTKITSKTKRYTQENKIQIIKPPIDEIVKQNDGLPVMENSVIIGAIWALLAKDFKSVLNQVNNVFAKKGKDQETNVKCAEDGFDFVRKQDLNKRKKYTPTKKKTERIIGTGNEVAGLATFAAGCRVYCAYPMTPSTGILHYLAARTDKTNMVVKQAEDEITAVQMATGASFAGTRSACGTSGGGLALMSETLSLIGMAELPLVVFNSQRPGPATGLPTWTEQGDLSFVSRIGHGDYPKIVIAPGDVDEVYSLVPQAFNLAEKYQTLVIVLLDKYISESWYQTKKFKDNVEVKRGRIADQKDLDNSLEFLRYKYTVSGVSPRSFPGMKKAVYLANSDEHDQKGYSTEDQLVRKKMMEKRMRKEAGIISDISEPELIGPKDAKVTVISWGSQKGPVVDTLKEINKAKKQINALHYSFVYPVRGEKLKSLAQTSKLVAVENNFSAQFAGLLRAETGVEIKEKITKYVGTPFFKDELAEILNKKI